MQAIVRVLKELGVDLDVKEHKAYKFEAKGFMPLSVEVWEEDKRGKLISLTHYGEQNGDLMADPDILCQIYTENFGEDPEKKLIPVHYQNDYLGVFQEAKIYREDSAVLISPKLTKSITSFLSTWAKNIKAQGFVKSKEVLA